MVGCTCHHSLHYSVPQVPSRASLLTPRHQLLPQWRRARTSPPKGLFGSGNDRKELVGAGASGSAFALPAYGCLLLI